MRKSVAITTAEKYAEEWDVEWGDAVEVKDRTAWWKFFVSTDFTISFESVSGKGEVDITSPGKVTRFEFYPEKSSIALMVPLWAAYPSYDAVTIGWRMGYGEHYRAYWNSWFEYLNENEREEYEKRFPPPDDPDLGWADFYHYLAEARRDDQNQALA